MNTITGAPADLAADATRVLEAVAVRPHAAGRPARREPSAWGNLRRLGRAVNEMVDRLALFRGFTGLTDFTGEMTRVAREAGAEGRLGGHAGRRARPGVGGT
ncbi:hypothetical protein ACFC96_23455 [Streptomyces sp. NPDC055955]|uniref:hypothetical protein n=1 Tax=Streptomyces sp. NPDC055955 TaxID=3345665 RepID=UPI0035DF0286